MTTPLTRLRVVIRDAIAAGESQNALAKRLGVSQPTVSAWLAQDGLDPKSSVLEAVARVLGVSGHWLLTGEGDRRSAPVGADAVYRQGIQAGLQRAEDAVRTLRISDAASAERNAREVAEAVDRAGQASPRKAAKPGPRGRRAG